VLSRDPSSTTITSKSRCRSASIALTLSTIVASSLCAGMITDTPRASGLPYASSRPAYGRRRR
jgi:hypothetical protein